MSTFLAEEYIQVTFDVLKKNVTSDRVRELTNYIDRTWINGTIWTPTTWTVYRMAVRTNNDVEGWHHRIRRAQKSCLPFSFIESTAHGDNQHPHPASDDQRRKTPEIPTKDYTTTTVPHQPTLGQLQRWIYQLGHTSNGMWADL